MPCSTINNKENQLLFSEDPANLDRSICKDKRSASIEITTSSSTDTRIPTSTDTLSSSTDTRSSPSTDTTLPSTDIFHPTSIDTSVHTSIDTQPRDMVALIHRQDENGDLRDQEGHLLPHRRTQLGKSCQSQTTAPTATRSSSQASTMETTTPETKGWTHILKLSKTSSRTSNSSNSSVPRRENISAYALAALGSKLRDQVKRTIHIH
ncbi:hypothetical protein Bca4012_020226 [Brassica carinata]